jgi:threonine synthase
MSIWNYADLLPPLAERYRISLGEGNTPLVRSRQIGPAAGIKNLFFKLESSNPTGSYKDRFAVAAVAHVLAAGKSAVLAPSSGNAGSALAAVCAAAQIPCFLAITEAAPESKLRQMLAYGAQLFRIRGFGPDPQVYDAVTQGLQPLADEMGAAMQISSFGYTPLGMAGVQTISYELAEQLPEGIDHVFTPAGGGGLTLAVARGFECVAGEERSASAPAVHCVQPAGNNTIASSLRQGEDRARECECTTAIGGLQVPRVADGNEVIRACRASGGNGYLVEDQAAYEAQVRLAREEGIFAEPAGATALAGMLDACARGELEADSRVVCLVTGSGFKDEVSIERMVQGRSAPMMEDFTQFRQACLEITER